MRGALMAVASGVALTACSVVGVRTVEEPAFRVVRMVGAVEVRAYGPRLAAEVAVGGDEIAARGTGFELLAGYIFGKNRARASVAMTAPVAQASEGGSSETVAMTAPVSQVPGGDGRWRVRFFMPASYTRATLPEPSDARVQIVEVPGEMVAVLRYSGVPTKAAVAEAQTRLVAALAGETMEGAPFSWFYDPPWTIPPLRRNEAVVRVAG